MCKLIVVQGEGEGVLGVFTDNKKAYECAKNFCEFFDYDREPLNISYDDFRYQIKKWGHSSVEGYRGKISLCIGVEQNEYSKWVKKKK